MKRLKLFLLIVSSTFALMACSKQNPTPEGKDLPDKVQNEELKNEDVKNEEVENEEEKNEEMNEEMNEEENETTEALERDFVAHYIRTDGYVENVEYPSVTLVNDREALDSYIKKYESVCNLSSNTDSKDGFIDRVEKYDATWFETQQLILVLLEESSGSIRHEVTKVTGKPENTIEINRSIPEMGTADMAEWHIVIELEKVFEPTDEISVNFTNVEPKESNTEM